MIDTSTVVGTRIDYAESLKLLGLVLTVVTAWGAILWTLLRPHFQRAVVRSLKDSEAEYKAWNDGLYKGWRDEQVTTSALATKMHDELMRQGAELTEFRTEVSRTLELLTPLPGALNHLASAVDRLTRTVETVDAKYQEQALALARLEGARGARRKPRTTP